MAITFDNANRTGTSLFCVWWVQLFGTGVARFRIATSEFSDGSYDYYPIIKNKPSIRTSINLAKSTAKTSDITLVCINEYLPSKLLSEELIGGTYNYINQKVVIQSSFMNNTNGVDTTIYTGRLTDVSHNHETCTLKIQSARPWDFITIPNKEEPLNKGYRPFAYGEFTPSLAMNVYSEKRLFPIKGVFATAGSSRKYYVLPEGITSGVNPHYYDKNCDQFFPIRELDGGALTTLTNGTAPLISNSATIYKDENGDDFEYTYIDKEVYRHVMTKPKIANFNEGAIGGWSTLTWTGSPNNGDGKETQVCDQKNMSQVVSTYLKFSINRGAYSSYIILSETNVAYIKFDLAVTHKAVADPLIYVTVGDWGKMMGATPVNDNYFWIRWADHEFADNGSSGGNVFSMEDANPPITTPANVSNGADFDAEDWNNMSSHALCFWHDDTTDYGNGTDDMIFRCTVYDVVVNLAVGFKIDTNFYSDEQVESEIEKIDTVYIGADGLPQSYTGGSGAVSTLPEMHRDLMKRALGVDEASPEGFSSLNGDRANWKCTWWANDPVKAQEVLDKIQYEGGFIFTYTAGGGMRYIYVKTSYSSSNYTFGDNDLSNVQINHTPFSELLTKMNIQYVRHPAKDSYAESSDNENSSSRTKWNIQTDENIEEVKLDALSNSTGVGEFYAHYDNIFGDIKTMISANVVNPAKWGVEVGDIVTFTDLGLKAYNTDLGAGDYFMITDVTRTLDSVKIKCREVS